MASESDRIVLGTGDVYCCCSTRWPVTLFLHWLPGPFGVSHLPPSYSTSALYCEHAELLWCLCSFLVISHGLVLSAGSRPSAGKCPGKPGTPPSSTHWPWARVLSACRVHLRAACLVSPLPSKTVVFKPFFTVTHNKNQSGHQHNVRIILTLHV